MSIGANKRVKPASAEPLREALAPAEALTVVYVVTRGGGGVVLSECEVPTSALRVVRKRPPDALAFALSTLQGWVAGKFERGR